MLSKDELDLSFTWALTDVDDQQQARVMEEPYMLACHSDHPLARRGSIALSDLDGVQVIANPELPGYMCNARGREAVVQVIDYERRLEAEAKVAALLEGERFQALCARLQAHCEFRMIGPGEANQEAILNAFQSHDVVIGHPKPHGLPPHMAPERILLESGVPLLIIPNAWQGETIGERIVTGWNATREARHAVAGAMAFLVAARAVTLLLTDTQEH